MRSRTLTAFLCLIGLTTMLTGCGSTQRVHVPGEDTYSASGRVIRNDNGQGVPEVRLSFGSFGFATTVDSGSWTKNGLRGTVILSPAKEGWTFSPDSIQISGVASGLTFVGTPSPTTYTVSGRVTRSDNGQGLSDVLISFGSFGSVLTYSDGTWQKTGLQGSVVVTPSKDWWTLSPNSVTVTEASTTVNFVGTEVGTPVGGVLNTDATWTLVQSPYKLTQDVQLAYGKTLSIEPGVVVNGNGHGIVVWGTLNAVGTSLSRIKFRDTHVIPGYNQPSSQPFTMRVEYAEMSGGSIYAEPAPGYRYGVLYLRDSLIRNSEYGKYMYLLNLVADSYIERNVFDTSGGIEMILDRDIRVYIRNNVFVRQTTPYAIQSYDSTNNAEAVVEYNSFLSTDRVALRLRPSVLNPRLSGPNNYWNTTDETVIQSMIYDRNDDLGCPGYITYTPFLTSPHVGTPAYW